MDESEIMEAVEYMVSHGTQSTNYGNWRFGTDELAEALGVAEKDIIESYYQIFEMLASREEVLDVIEDTDDGVALYDISFGTKYCPNLWPY